ncbi:S1C family serine protease [Inhella gelatinilytica]|uniref:Trypsin-like peptidase domain-containing protein n=1 Tax=Inhella gelatinilytica TaxID=2795030 RepID=A0A931NAW7_9BURK|nr:trypsin-like peptidase domain-containing protein [Inhella gelatinilytica]MBH9552933.1 trypsin-like peptidase domain-containing protein [Inhella gelatinilytica]
MTAPSHSARLTALGLSAAALVGAAWLWPTWAQTKPDAQPRPVLQRGAFEADELNHIRVFKTVSPSVVHITTTAVQRDFFSNPVREVPQGTGSGFVWDESGHIVTNFHVVQNAEGVKVTLADQSEWAARVVGAFPDRDLAVLKVDWPASKHPPIPIGTSRDLQVGQKVYAIGNPFGLDFTLTTGIVSALNREIESVTRRSIRGAIQTDAAINPGNSGGPLLDSAGRLIGVNTAIYSPSGASAGIGFAIPVDEVNRIVPRLIRDGRFVRPVLGITPLDERWTATLRRRMGLPKGVALVGVTAQGPAARAGLRPFSQNRNGQIEAGDVITAVNDTPVADFDDLLNELEKRQAGDQVRLTVERDGRRRQVGVQLRAGD